VPSLRLDQGVQKCSNLLLIQVLISSTTVSTHQHRAPHTAPTRRSHARHSRWRISIRDRNHTHRQAAARAAVCAIRAWLGWPSQRWRHSFLRSVIITACSQRSHLPASLGSWWSVSSPRWAAAFGSTLAAGEHVQALHTQSVHTCRRRWMGAGYGRKAERERERERERARGSVVISRISRTGAGPPSRPPAPRRGAPTDPPPSREPSCPRAARPRPPWPPPSPPQGTRPHQRQGHGRHHPTTTSGSSASWWSPPCRERRRRRSWGERRGLLVAEIEWKCR
jgi:hypothetical protein